MATPLPPCHIRKCIFFSYSHMPVKTIFILRLPLSIKQAKPNLLFRCLEPATFGLVNVFLSLKSWSFDFISPQDIVSFSNSIISVKRFRIASIQTDGAGVSLNRSLDEVLAAKHPQLTAAKIGIGGSNPRKGLEIILSCPNLTVKIVGEITKIRLRNWLLILTVIESPTRVWSR